MKDEIKKIYDELAALQMRLHSFLASVPSEISGTSVADLVDAGFLCREAANIGKDIKTNCEARKDLIGKYLAARAAAAAMQDEVLPLKGELATATPTMQSKPNIPDVGSEEYNQLLRWCGVSDEVIKRDLIRPSFTSLQDTVTRFTIEGKPLPPGISLVYTETTVVYRKKMSKKTNGQQEEF